MSGADATGDGVPLWREDTVPARAPHRGASSDDLDVAIVGAGFSGLWTAYYLAARDPSLRIAVFERSHVGFGASGRNGGWCVGGIAAPLPTLESAAGREPAIEMVRAMHETVDEVGAVVAREQIDCHFAKGGTINFATTRPQLDRLRARIELVRHYGFGEDDYRLLSARDATDVVNAAGVHGALFSPHCAALHPGRLVRGLAGAVERAGVTIYEGTPVRAIEPGGVVVDGGRVPAEIVVRATEAYTASLTGHERAMLPIGNHMIATAPLSAATWDEIGLRQRETFEDGRHVIFYGQRTADDRIAFGGLSIPYRYGSGTDVGQPRIYERLRRTLGELFPVLEGVDVTHRWAGVLGATRDTFPSVGYDSSSGFAWAGGYVGEGVAAANLAGRTLADLITKTDSDLVRLPWVNHRSPDWEPEPWRWLEFNLIRATLAAVDGAEKRTGRHQRWAGKLLEALIR